MTTLDYAPLSSRVSGKELREFRNAPGVSVPHLTGAAAIVAAMAVIVVAALALLTAGEVLWLAFTSEGAGDLPIGIAFLLIAGIVIAATVLRGRTARARLLRLYRFAEANGLALATNAEVPDYPGAIFGIGSNHTIAERLSRSSTPAVDIGDLRYTTGSGKSRTTHEWGYVAIRLDRMLPQMVLDAKSNNFLGTNLPSVFSRKQVLRLEGDFDRYFTLYCPQEYESDALYVFTPDLMARLVDEAALFDVEIVDDWMFLYSAKPFDLADRATLERVFRVVDTVGARTLDRTRRYADAKVAGADAGSDAGSILGARMAVNAIAPEGRRLRRGVSALGVAVFLAALIAWVVLTFFTPFLGG